MSQKTYEEMQNEISNLHKIITEKDIEIENLKLHINTLNKYIFGSKRELTPKEYNIVEGTQCSIFGEIEDENLKEQVEEKTEEIIVHKKKSAKKQQSGIKKSELKNIEQETIILKLEDDQLKCPECGADLKKIGTEVVRQEIEYVPAKLKLKTYVRETYKCEECGTEASEKETATIVKTKYATIRINNNNKEIKNTNELLLENVDGVYGVKTGFTNIAGRCLVTAVKRKEMDLIIIVIGADTKKYRGTDTLKLLDYVEKNYKKEDIENKVKDAFQNWKEINENRIQIYKGNSKLNTKIGEIKYKKLLTKSEINVDFNNVILLKAPVEKNQKIGEIIVRNGEEVLEKIDILSEDKIEKRSIKDYFIIFAKEFTH